MAKKCMWCDHRSDDVNTYKVTGFVENKKTTVSVRLCTCCVAWGVLSENWYDIRDRIETMTGVFFDSYTTSKDGSEEKLSPLKIA